MGHAALDGPARYGHRYPRRQAKDPHSAVASDVIAAAHRIIALVDTHVDDEGNPLSYRDGLLAEVSTVLESAVKEWAEGLPGQVSRYRYPSGRYSQDPSPSFCTRPVTKTVTRPLASR